MHSTSPNPKPYTQVANLTAHAKHLYHRWRRTITLNVIRGASYGVGTTAISLIMVWAHHRY